MRNSGVLFTPQGTIGWEYAKAFPGPGFEDVFIEAGRRDIPYLDIPYGRIGQVICADMICPHYLRQAAVKESASPSLQIKVWSFSNWDSQLSMPHP